MQLEKVTAFVTRPRATGTELLLFRHPNAGIQLSAGADDDGEPPEETVRREIWEETGLRDVTIQRRLGSIEEALPGHVFICFA